MVLDVEKNISMFTAAIQQGVKTVILPPLNTINGSNEEKREFIDLACNNKIKIKYHSFNIDLSDTNVHLFLEQLILEPKSNRPFFDTQFKLNYLYKENPNNFKETMFYDILEINMDQSSELAYMVIVGKPTQKGIMNGIDLPVWDIMFPIERSRCSSQEELEEYIFKLKKNYPDIKKW
jgi:hypothetical protein